MKNPILFRIVFIALILILSSPHSANAQLFDKIKQRVKETSEDHVVNDAGNATDKAIDKTEDSIGKSIKGKGKADAGAAGSTDADSETATSANSEASGTITTYKNYDFVPGDTVIFESQLTEERIGEIPSQLIVSDGQLDIQQIGGENVIHIPKGSGAAFTPRMTKRKYMPDQFTVEFDYLNEENPLDHLNISFGGNDDDDPELSFYGENLSWASADDINMPEGLKMDPTKWHHIAIAINKNAGKGYVNQFRVVNVNNLAGKADNVTFNVHGYEDSYIRNIRIAAGGIDIYKKVSTDSKIIMHGILFDTDKATLKPESMGSINQIYNLMKKQPDLKFEIDGFTDNTGEAAHNLTLSQHRADAVKAQLISMGIESSRLTTKGFGDTKPISDNTTPEGRANNRRVEFVKT